jgi:hypothetical protein
MNAFDPASAYVFDLSTDLPSTPLTFPEPSPIISGWIEPVSHFFSNSSSAILYQSIAVSLQRHEVVIDIQPLQYKIFCRYGMVTFSVRIFANNDGAGNTYVPLEDFVIAEINRIVSSPFDTDSAITSVASTSASVKAATEVLKTVKYVVEFQRRTVSYSIIIIFVYLYIIEHM